VRTDPEPAPDSPVFADRDGVLAAFADAPAVDADAVRADLDAAIDQETVTRDWRTA
jgi:hypothetical protein